MSRRAPYGAPAPCIAVPALAACYPDPALADGKALRTLAQGDASDDTVGSRVDPDELAGAVVGNPEGSCPDREPVCAAQRDPRPDGGRPLRVLERLDGRRIFAGAGTRRCNGNHAGEGKSADRVGRIRLTGRWYESKPERGPRVCLRTIDRRRASGRPGTTG